MIVDLPTSPPRLTPRAAEALMQILRDAREARRSGAVSIATEDDGRVPEKTRPLDLTTTVP